MRLACIVVAALALAGCMSPTPETAGRDVTYAENALIPGAKSYSENENCWPRWPGRVVGNTIYISTDRGGRSCAYQNLMRFLQSAEGQHYDIAVQIMCGSACVRFTALGTNRFRMCGGSVLGIHAPRHHMTGQMDMLRTIALARHYPPALRDIYLDQVALQNLGRNEYVTLDADHMHRIGVAGEC